MFRVAIVGMGPKGLYCLERLIAEFNSVPASDSLHIDIFNRSDQFGASPIYDSAQPDYVLTNIKVGEINLWDAIDPTVVAQGGLDFVSWHRQKFGYEGKLTGEEYLPRALVGCYLTDGFRRILDQLPLGITVCCHIGEVTDIEPRSEGYAITCVSDGRAKITLSDKVLLATGHSWLQPGEEETRWSAFAARHEQLNFIPFVYPVETQMSEVPAGTTVAMLGIGLTFIDAVLALTEGREGRFRRSSDGSLVYEPSGREPGLIVPFSRSGLPMTPKSDDLPIAPPELSLLTTQTLQDLRQKSPGGKLELAGEVWRLCELEMELHYYRVIVGSGPEREHLESSAAEPRSLRRFIERYLRNHPHVAPFHYRQVLDPVADCRMDAGAQFNRFVERYMEQEIVRARLGQSGSPVKAAIEVWYQIRSALGSVLRNGGFTPHSHRLMIEELFPQFKRVAFGPPCLNIEKLLALVKARLIDFSLARRPDLHLNDRLACFELKSSMFAEECIRVQTLIDARYPQVDVANDATPLIRNLRRRGMIRAIENKDDRVDSLPYRPGAIDMTYPLQFVVSEAGLANEDLSVIGIPTEGNLIGNLTMARDSFAGIWAAETMRQLRGDKSPLIDGGRAGD